ncbi:MAG: hypothetical protein JSR21_12600 [Proteobacteria bacterium]|nr:hypothetical protein [Pseudomonadota bacterium]
MAIRAIPVTRAEPQLLGVNRAGLAFALLLGGFHLVWALLVAARMAQPLIDFVFWLHFIRPAFVIEEFDPFRAAGLVLFTSAVGYLTGAAFALLWNRVRSGGT